jgi:site-specific recombinase XerC
VFWRSGVKVAAWDGMSGHALRHTCATEVLDSCHDLRAVQELLGHDSLQSTQVYLGRFGAERLRAAMEGRTYNDLGMPDAA